MKICVLIPALNEARMIGEVIAQVSQKGFSVVVIDDGSTDQTGDIAKKAGATVIRNEEKQGKGKSLQRGFEYILSQDYTDVITMDADGQHAVADLDQFVEKARYYPGSIITGTRMQNNDGMPVVRLWTNQIMSLMISAVCRQRIPDTQCGFRLISGSILRQIELRSSDFQIETEVLIKAAKKGFKIYSVPVKTIYRDEDSKINPFIDTYRFLIYFVKELCSK